MNRKKIILFFLITILSVISGYFIHEKFFLKRSMEATVTPTNDEQDSQGESIPVEYEIPLDKEWLVSFGEPLDADSIQKRTVFVQDKDGNPIDVPISLLDNNHTVSIKAPKGGYQKGEYYELHMTKEITYTDGTSVSRYLKQGFITVRDAAEEAVYSKDVKEIEESAVLSVSDKTVTLDKSKLTEEIKKDNILVLPSEDEIVNKQAIKVTSIKEKNGNYTVGYRIPEFSELFEKLNVYKTYHLDSSQAKFIPKKGVDAQLVGVVNRNTSIAASERKKAKDGGEFEFKDDEDTSVETVFKDNGVEILVKDLPVDFNGYGAKLDGTYRILDPKFHFDIDIDWGDIERFNSYFTYQNTSDLKTKIELSKKELRSIKDYVKDKKPNWALEDEVPLGTLSIPTAIPGLSVTTEVSLVLGLSPDGELSRKITLQNFVNSKIKPKIGVITKNKKVQPVFELNPEVNAGFSAQGEAKGKVTGELQVTLRAFDIVGTGLEAEAGGYVEGNFNIGTGTSDKFFSCGKYEVGLLASAQVLVDSAWDEELASAKLAELKYELKSLNSCDELKGISVSPEKPTLEPGEKVKLSVKGLYKDKLTGVESKRSLLEGNLKDLSIETSDASVANVILREYKKKDTEIGGGAKKGELKLTIKGKSTKAFKGYIEVPEDVSKDTATVYVNYKKFHEEIPIKIEGMKVSEEVAKELTSKSLDGIKSSFKELGERYRWHNSLNPPDFNILREELVKYATPSFVDSKLKGISEEVYCDCDARFLPFPELDIRFKLIENKPNEFVVETIEVSNLVSDTAGVVTFTMKRKKDSGENKGDKKKEEWYMDDWKKVKYTEQSLDLTWDEAQEILKENGGTYKYIKTANHKGRELFIFEDLRYNQMLAMYRDNGREAGEVLAEMGYY